jgi:hypothetical protein
MPCAVNAFNVKIASPGETAMELIIAREVIWAWNEQHALERKQILLPLYRKEAHESCPGDLLIAFFCASAIKAQSPERKDVSAAIEQHLEAGRPVLIYFSEARVDLEEVSFEQEEELFRLGKRYGGRAKIDAYGNDKEFRAKLTRDLEASLAEHAHFQLEARSSETVAVAPPVVTPPAPPPEKKLSEHAVTLLSEACEDFEAYIGRNKIGTTLKIQANGKQLVNHGDPDDAARWDSAVQELISGAYIHDVGYNGQLFQITGKGFAFLKSIGKTPVGYIAEMGGM